MTAKRSAGPSAVAIDTNLVLSALVFAQGRLTALRSAWQWGARTPLVSQATVAELIRVLAYPKFKLSAANCEGLLTNYLPCCRSMRIPATLSKLRFHVTAHIHSRPFDQTNFTNNWTLICGCFHPIQM